MTEETARTSEEDKSLVERIDSAPFRYRFGGFLFMAGWSALWIFGPEIPIFQPGTLQEILALSTIQGRMFAFLISLMFAWPVGLYVGYLTWDMVEMVSSEQHGGKHEQ